jgi:hypothetical protein
MHKSSIMAGYQQLINVSAAAFASAVDTCSAATELFNSEKFLRRVPHKCDDIFNKTIDNEQCFACNF